ncbi:hypothetical protein [Actinobaculum sp. 313]|uniref:hypothetical protein n=1 Tax=Actinobaculum sp. 313 TaxID=2495645 RepID=UPI000D526CCE|nr:hypothetical protein [Actinobaculum sp. 313]AWE43041.1 hypothetical protein DDD63_10160 [Actinobaculum sp. 313]
MSTITVDFDALDHLSAIYHNLADTTTQSSPNARSYIRDNIVVPNSGSLGYVMSDIIGYAQQVTDAVSQCETDAEKALRGGADAVDECRRHYENSDQNVITLFDGKYTSADVNTAKSTPSTPVTGCLPPAVAETTFADVFSSMGMVGNVISPSFWLGEGADIILDFILGEGEHNPFDAIPGAIAGDWEAVSRAGNGLGHLADYFSALASESTNTWSDTASEWEGEQLILLRRPLARCRSHSPILPRSYANSRQLTRA